MYKFVNLHKEGRRNLIQSATGRQNKNEICAYTKRTFFKQSTVKSIDHISFSRNIIENDSVRFTLLLSTTATATHATSTLPVCG